MGVYSVYLHLRGMEGDPLVVAVPSALEAQAVAMEAAVEAAGWTGDPEAVVFCSDPSNYTVEEWAVN